MKKKTLFVFTLFLFLFVIPSKAQDMDEYDNYAKYSIDIIELSNKCDCNVENYENYQFRTSNFQYINSYLHNQAANKSAWEAWQDEQSKLIQDEIENLYNQEFSSFEVAVLHLLNEGVSQEADAFVSLNRISSENIPKFYNSKENKALHLTELLHLNTRKNEILNGNLNNSIFTFSQVDGIYLKDIKDSSTLNSLLDGAKDSYSTNAATEHIASQFALLTDNFDKEGFGEYMHKYLNDYYDDDINKGEANYLAQYYANTVYFNRNRNFVEATPNTSIERQYAYIIGNMPRGTEDNILGFLWDNMTMSVFDPDYWEYLYDLRIEIQPFLAFSRSARVGLEAETKAEAAELREEAFNNLVNDINEEDLLIDLAITGLGDRNNTFLNARPNLRAEVEEYFKTNFLHTFDEVRQNSIDGMNWLLNRYQDGLLFEVDEGIYTTRYKTLSDANNPDLAFRLCSSREGSEHGLDGFGNVLAVFFKEETNANFKGFIIKEMFASNGIHVPAEVPNSWYGENFTFSEDIGACITIMYANGNDSYEPKKKWFKDKDKDGYHEKGSSAKEQVASPGEEWVEGVSKDEDCDDTNANRKTAEDCEKCKTTKEDLKKIFTTISDDKLKKIAEAINDNAKKFGIDTKEKLQHFLAQAGHESNKFTAVEENLNYRLAKLGVDYWKKYFNPQSNPTIDSLKQNPNDYKKSPTSTSLFVDNEKFANHVYGGRMGNNTTGDGYKYRGRGIFQLTGKNNYQSFTTFYQNDIDSTKNFITNPDLVASDIKIGIISAMWFYKNNVLDKLTVNKDTTVKSVTKKVNGGTNGLSDREEIHTKAKEKIDCK